MYIKTGGRMWSYRAKEMVSGFLDCDDTEYHGILDALGAGIYIRATVH